MSNLIWENNIKINSKKAVCEDVYCVYLPYIAFKLWIFMNAIINELHKEKNCPEN
jgi:hypothetical protein